MFRIFVKPFYTEEDRTREENGATDILGCREPLHVAFSAFRVETIKILISKLKYLDIP